jgi:hypothetical protein
MAVCFLIISVDGGEYLYLQGKSLRKVDRLEGRCGCCEGKEMAYISQKLNFSPLIIAVILTELFRLPELK